MTSATDPTSNLSEKHCVPCEGGVPKLDRDQAAKLLNDIGEGWLIQDDEDVIYKDYQFKGFNRTMGFVNAVAWIANSENHHPDLEVGYNHCLVKYSTHAIGGLSENDFICAAKIEALISG